MTANPDNQRTGGRDVFVSYASQDVAVANAIVEALECHGVKCWIAPRDVVPGEFYAGAIVHAIDAAKVIVLVLSKNAATSQHVLREVERASAKRQPVVSFRTDLSPMPADLEYFLNTSHWLDASGVSVEHALPKLVDAVQRAGAAAADATPGDARVAAKPVANLSQQPPITSHRLNRPVLALSVLIALGLSYFAADKLWFSKRTPSERPVATVAPAATALAPAVSEKSVAVLPFLDMSEKRDQEYFSDGLSEELIDMLTKIPELRVPARTSSFYFKGKQATVPDIAKALSVTHVLEGSVRKSGNHLRITAQLVRADNGYHLWSETYDRQLDDIFKVQDEIAGAVVKALKISLMGASLPESTGTQNIEAYNLFLQARSMRRHANEPADFKRVGEYLRRAIEADPQFANAWALLSNALRLEAITSDEPDQKLIEEARRAAKQALKLNSALPDPHLAYAAILMFIDLDVRGAEAEIQQALELDPNSTEALGWAAQLPMYRGQFGKALELAQKSIAIDPVNPIAYNDLELIYYFAGKYPEGLTANRKMLDLDPGARKTYHWRASYELLAKGDPAAALAEIESDKEVRENCPCLVLAYDALGRRGEADAALANLEKHHAANTAFQIGLVYATRGEFDQAFGWFDRAYRQRDEDLFFLKVSPWTKNVRSDPRFNALLRKLGLLD